MFEIIATVIGVLAGAVSLNNDLPNVHNPFSNEVPPHSPKWYELCSNTFKSFNPETGLWKDNKGKYHYCRFVYVK